MSLFELVWPWCLRVNVLATLLQEKRRWLRSANQSEAQYWLMARLQNPASQTQYASYRVRSVCFFLCVLADEEQQIVRFEQRQS